MRRHEKDKLMRVRIGLALLVLLILVLLIWNPFSSNDNSKLNETESLAENKNLATDDLGIIEDKESEVADDTIKETLQLEDSTNDKEEIKPTTTLKAKGLCEDYLFVDGSELKIDGHKIVVEAIGDESVKIVVDGERTVLSEEENEYFESGIRLGIDKGSIFYHKSGSDENVAEIRVGCNYGTNPNEKYIEQEGRIMCENAYEVCLDTFNIEDDN